MPEAAKTKTDDEKQGSVNASDVRREKCDEMPNLQDAGLGGVHSSDHAGNLNSQGHADELDNLNPS